MKKIIVLLVALLMVLSCVSCGKGVLDTPAKEFSVDGLTITLTESFKAQSTKDYVAYFEAPGNVVIFVLKEAFSEGTNVENLTLEEYVDAVYLTHIGKDPDDIITIDELPVMEYSDENTQFKETYRFFTVMFKGPDAFWSVQFSCLESEYEAYRPHFIEWAKTVTFDAAE